MTSSRPWKLIIKSKHYFTAITNISTSKTSRFGERVSKPEAPRTNLKPKTILVRPKQASLSKLQGSPAMQEPRQMRQLQHILQGRQQSRRPRKTRRTVPVRILQRNTPVQEIQQMWPMQQVLRRISRRWRIPDSSQKQTTIAEPRQKNTDSLQTPGKSKRRR